MNYERKDIQLLSLMWKISDKGKEIIILLNTAYEICSWDTIENTALIYNAIKCIGDEPSTNDLQRFLRHFERY